MSDFLDVCVELDPTESRLSEKIGAATLVMARFYSNLNIDRVIRNIILPAALHSQLHVFTDEDGSPVAFVAWATTSAEYVQVFASALSNAPHLADWSEGSLLTPAFICARPGYGARAVRAVLSQLPEGLASIEYYAEARGRKTGLRRLQWPRPGPSSVRSLVCRCGAPKAWAARFCDAVSGSQCEVP